MNKENHLHKMTLLLSQSSMDAHTFLIQLVIIFFAARLVGEIAGVFKIPSVIGELFAGILIGPNMLDLVEMSNPIHLLAQIGIILLLFEVGLETEISKLISAGGKAVVVASGGVIRCFMNFL